MAFIDLSGDGGVQKKILKEGTGEDTPSNGCSVVLHYTGTLDADGKQFDSSRDRNEPFEFKLGQGSVIKAFDMGVLTMKLGEKSILKCAPEYAYGASGSPPNIPPNATLNFELEMLGWKGEDLSPKSDRSIERFILKTGEGKKTPNDGALVKVDLVGRHEGRIFEERNVEFNIGEGEIAGVVSGVELALEKFKKVETSKLIIKPQFAFGEKGNPELGVPPNATVEYTVTLNEFEREIDSWKLDDEERLAQGKLFKERGTNYFKENKFSIALKMYEKSLGFLSSSDSEESKQLKLAIYLNIALCQQKMSNFDDAKDACNEALNIDNKNVKALYRRGQALLSLGDFERALEDFSAVQEIEPENKAALNQITICKQKVKLYNDQQKKVFANMFTKFAKSDKQREEEEQSRQPDVMKQNFGEWRDDEREHEPTRFEQENPDVIMLSESLKEFRNM
ncbi:FK506-binding protein 59 isoform X2 [Toxorhynchites rutilus septentrionalis]|uniref:FK506-binding protein 59 isoform X2 n=1 Tax=Toxorhynchites rutilus septentrionalis TaxID=329112 RepID=UPI00247851F7|nr:FK506-binding protein 59 isoform X2 [Toxorhynchites rutilus septentrionalis]